MGNLNALVVDDSKVGRLTMTKKLEALGIQVQLAESGQEALDHLERTRPDMIFMDHQMPGMDGFETTRRIKSSHATRHIPVIVISGNEGPDFLRQAREAGALDAIVKPPATEALEQIIGALPCPAPDAPVSTPIPDADALERLHEALLSELDRRQARQEAALADLGRRLTDLEGRLQGFDQRLLILDAEAGRPDPDIQLLRAELKEIQTRGADPKPLLEELRQSLMTLVADHAGLTASRNAAIDLRLAALHEEMTGLAQDLHSQDGKLAALQTPTPARDEETAAVIQELRAELGELGERWNETRMREMMVDTLKHLKSAKEAQAARDARDAQESEAAATAAAPQRNLPRAPLAAAVLLGIAVAAWLLMR